MEKTHLSQAKLWFDGAESVANSDTESNAKYAVAVAMLVHSILTDKNNYTIVVRS